MPQLGRGSKDPDSASGAPFPPAEDHTDGPERRPRRDVPTADATVDETAGEKSEVEPEEEESR